MKQLKELEEAEQILTEEDMKDLIEPATSLTTDQTQMALLLGKKFVLVNYQTGFLPSKTYMCVYEGGVYVWKLINYVEEGYLEAPKNVWAKSTRDENTGRATIYIHWDDPEDTEDAHWAYSVIVKKKGSEPTSLYDGQVVGYSSIRNQYSTKLSFMDSLDIDTVDDRDILEGKIIPVEDTERYWYRIFAVSKYGKITGSAAFLGQLTWKKLQELIRAGVADHAVSIGDVVQVQHSSMGTLDFQVVAFDNAKAVDEKGKEYAHSVTFMSCDVLFRGSFDHQEQLYAEQPNHREPDWSKQLYKDDKGTPFESVQKAREAYDNYEHVYERNPCYISAKSNASIYGRNAWVESNARAWLNSEHDVEDWYKLSEKCSIWEAYADKKRDDEYQGDIELHGSYGSSSKASAGYKLFTGFKAGLESELQEVMKRSKVRTTQPIWRRADPSQIKIEVTYDYVFLPSYAELFGEDYPFPADVGRQDILDPDGKPTNEGFQFDIYRLKLTKTRMKKVLFDYNTTTAGQADPEDNLASWYMRTPVRMPMKDPWGQIGTTTDYDVDCVEIVTADNRQYNNIIDLDEDGGTGRQAYMPAPVNGDSDIPRDSRKNQVKPEGSSLEYSNNTAPGFVPCFVVA